MRPMLVRCVVRSILKYSPKDCAPQRDATVVTFNLNATSLTHESTDNTCIGNCPARTARIVTAGVAPTLPIHYLATG